MVGRARGWALAETESLCIPATLAQATCRRVSRMLLPCCWGVCRDEVLPLLGFAE